MKQLLLLSFVALLIVSQVSAGLEDDLVLYLTFDNVKGRQDSGCLQ